MTVSAYMKEPRSGGAPAWATAKLWKRRWVALDAYSQVLPGMQERDVNAMDNFLT